VLEAGVAVVQNSENMVRGARHLRVEHPREVRDKCRAPDRSQKIHEEDFEMSRTLHSLHTILTWLIVPTLVFLPGTVLGVTAAAATGAESQTTDSGLIFNGWYDYVSFGDVLDMGTQSFTLEAWVKADAIDGTHKIVNKGLTNAGTTNAGYHLRIQDAELEFQVRDVTDAYYTVTVSAPAVGEWHHVAGVLDRASDSLTLYVDGTLMDTKTIGSLGSLDTNVPLALGVLERGSGHLNSEYFDGSMDEVRILNRALSAGEVQADFAEMGRYLPRSGTLAWYHMDENAGSSLNDDSGNGNVGTIYGVSWDAGFNQYAPGYGLTFDGVDDYVTVGDVLDMGTQSFTLEAWVKADAIDGTHKIVNKGLTNAGTTNAGYHLRIQDGGLEFQVRDTTNTPYTVTVSAPAVGEWHHVAGVLDRASDSLLLYVDGTLMDAKTIGSLGSLDTNVPLALGVLERGSGHLNSEYFDGSMDEVRILNRALSAGEVQADFAVLGHYPLHSGTLAWYHMDENNGSSLNDASDNGYTGAIYGASWSMGFAHYRVFLPLIVRNATETGSGTMAYRTGE
jgi:hypothetical protein